MIEDIVAARAEGARLVPACEVVGISLRTYRRWNRGTQVKADGRLTAVHPAPRHRLSEAERAQVLHVCNEPRFASLPPRQNSCHCFL
jgi:putative transposase